jgi:hypothetical protein
MREWGGGESHLHIEFGEINDAVHNSRARERTNCFVWIGVAVPGSKSSGIGTAKGKPLGVTSFPFVLRGQQSISGRRVEEE